MKTVVLFSILIHSSVSQNVASLVSFLVKIGNLRDSECFKQLELLTLEQVDLQSNWSGDSKSQNKSEVIKEFTF